MNLTCDDKSGRIDKNLKVKSIAFISNMISSNKISFIINRISIGYGYSGDNWVCGWYISERVLKPIDHESLLGGRGVKSSGSAD